MRPWWLRWLAGVLLLCCTACSAAGPGSAVSSSDTERKEDSDMEQTVFYLMVGGTTFDAAFADNAGAQAFRQWLADGDVTVRMEDYAGFEKVGALGKDLPTRDVQTTTQAGDIVLYLGNQIVLFYGSNSWSYTRLGKVRDLTGWEEALGSGDVDVTFSLTSPNP